jgi:parallel beta helix pectate lyase-like protein/hemolysin type calcium-binding protein
VSARERRRKRRRLAAGAGLGIGAALSASATAQAADFTVTNLNDDGAGSLRQAVLDANANPGADRILFQSGLTGTITLTSQITIDGSVEILGPGPGQLAVSGNGATRIFYSYPASLSESVSISGLKLTNGTAGTGGAIRTGKVNLTLSNTLVTGNTTSGGGGNGGAGLYAEYGSLSIQNSTISGNTATTGRGGALRTYRTPTSIQDSTISGNSATQAGGRGGGIYLYRDSLSVQGSTIAGNTSVSVGGGIHTFNVAVTVQRSTISGNSAGSGANYAGGIYAYGGSLSVQSSTVAGNRGGGIYSFNGNPDPSLVNTIVADNTATTGPDLYSVLDVFNASFSLIENPSGATIAGNPNILGQDPKLGPLADNGGPTQTQALGEGSPAIDQGLASGTDQRGAPRPFDFAQIALAGSNQADIGAYERVLCGGKLVNRIGTNGNDTLTGTPGPDGILGLGGADLLKGLAAGDGLCGGDGKDKLKGGSGKDKLLGENGKDKLKGGKGNDVLKGGRGADVLIGGKGREKLKGGPSKDKQKQ